MIDNRLQPGTDEPELPVTQWQVDEQRAWTRYKRIVILLSILAFLMILSVLCADGAALLRSATLHWEYPAMGTNATTFKLYTSTNLSTPISRWQLLTSTNIVPPRTTNFMVKYSVPIQINLDTPQRWFALSSSNWLGEIFSFQSRATAPIVEKRREKLRSPRDTDTRRIPPPNPNPEFRPMPRG